jgi:hypothetical protein
MSPIKRRIIRLVEEQPDESSVEEIFREIVRDIANRGEFLPEWNAAEQAGDRENQDRHPEGTLPDRADEGGNEPGKPEDADDRHMAPPRMKMDPA